MKLGSVFGAAIWTYIEPDAGIISACLPFLANVFGHRVIGFLKDLSDWGAKMTLTNRKKTTSTRSGTQRATYEAFDLDEESQLPIPAVMKLGVK